MFLLRGGEPVCQRKNKITSGWDPKTPLLPLLHFSSINFLRVGSSQFSLFLGRSCQFRRSLNKVCSCYTNNSSCLKQIISVFAFLLPRRFLGLRLFTKVSEDPQIAAFHDRPHLEWIAPPKDPDGDPDEGLGPFPCVEPEVPPHNEQYALNDFQVKRK